MVKQVFIDVETTGVNHWQNSVHQISGGVYINNELKESFDFKIKPHEKSKIEQGALDVGGLTLEQVMSYPHRMEVFPKLTSIFNKYVDKYKKQDKFFFLCIQRSF
ncbi:exonuclease domain-containing protein [Tenacibaculum maritimum]|uniref:exonuclease domain-containing protein n=1 Tax=Tenacibaculum maritimum TaxID=107401 RepID=UPI003875DB52